MWRETPAARVPRIDDSCPYCANRRLLRGFNDLATARPDVAAEWDLDRNGGILPVDVRFNSSRKAWWLGSCGHSWDMPVSARAVGGCGCPYCSGHRVLAGFNDLVSQGPDIAAQWDHGRNGGVRPEGIVAGSAFKAWWVCDSGHSWRMSVYNRTAGADRGCPYCGGRKALAGFNDLATTHPRLAAQWDYERNGSLRPEDVLAGSCKRVGWVCGEGHRWSALVASRAKGKNGDPGCPYCKREKGARRLQRPRDHASRGRRDVAPEDEQAPLAGRCDGNER